MAESTDVYCRGTIFILYGGMMWKNMREVNVNQSQQLFSARRQVAFAASVSLLNPHAIMDTIGVIGTSSLAYTGYEKILFAAACIAVS